MEYSTEHKSSPHRYLLLNAILPLAFSDVVLLVRDSSVSIGFRSLIQLATQAYLLARSPLVCRPRTS